MRRASHLRFAYRCRLPRTRGTPRTRPSSGTSHRRLLASSSDSPQRRRGSRFERDDGLVRVEDDPRAPRETLQNLLFAPKAVTVIDAQSTGGAGWRCAETGESRHAPSRIHRQSCDHLLLDRVSDRSFARSSSHLDSRAAEAVVTQRRPARTRAAPNTLSIRWFGKATCEVLQRGFPEKIEKSSK